MSEHRCTPVKAYVGYRCIDELCHKRFQAVLMPVEPCLLTETFRLEHAPHPHPDKSLYCFGYPDPFDQDRHA